MDPRVRITVEEVKESKAELQRDKWAERSRIHVTEQGGGSEGNRD